MNESSKAVFLSYAVLSLTAPLGHPCPRTVTVRQKRRFASPPEISLSGKCHKIVRTRFRWHFRVPMTATHAATASEAIASE